MKSKFCSMILGVILFSLLACSTEDENQSTSKDEISEKQVVTIMTHDSFSVSKAVISKFEETHHAKMIILKSGDAGEALNKAILSKNNPLADIFYGVDNTFLGRALAEDLFISYAPQHLGDVAQNLKLDPENRLIPVDFGDVCLNYDIQWFKENNLSPPAMLEDLIKPEYKSLMVVQNPATSSPGLAFLLSTISRFGQDGYLAYWEKLKSNDLLITNGWKEAYWGNFTAASDGDRPMVVSYASSPAAEVFFSDPRLAEAPTGIVTANGSAFRQIEFAGILNGASNIDLAKKAMDFILSKEFQEDIPLQMFVFPANQRAKLPDVFEKYASMAKAPAVLDSQLINAKRETWIREWAEKLLQ